MALTFPNPSRSYDEAGQRIRFHGYDGMFETPFFLQVAALSKAKSKAPTSELEYLAAFDALRDSIYSVAREAYSNGRKNMYMLTAADFR